MHRRTSLALSVGGICLFVCNVLYIWRGLQSTHSCQQSEQGPGTKDTKQEANAEPKLVQTLRVNPMDSTLERELPPTFRRALETYPVVRAADVKIVLIVSYYRSGSSFVGELLSSGPRTFFHFEPLMPFTVSGRIRPGRQGHAFQLLDELVRCRMQNVPLYTVWLENNPYYKYNHFLADLCGGGEPCSSPGHMSALCSRAMTQVFKFTRLSVSQVGAWIQKNPDLAHSVRVVHLVRDPRAIYSSRRGLRWCTDNEACDSAAVLCAQMRSDLNEFEELTSKMHPGMTYTLRFEDLATDPANETARLFERLGLDFAPSVSEYLETHTSASSKDLRSAHSTKRNTKQVTDTWRQKLSRKQVDAIERSCGDVLQRLNYERLSTEAFVMKRYEIPQISPPDLWGKNIVYGGRG